MKNLFILTLVIFICTTHSVKSQKDFWSEPFPLTDSVSFNSNPAIYTSDNGYGTTFVFYEKKWDEQSLTQIWIKNITDSLTEQPLFADDNIEFRNPKSAGNYLLYESNPNGNFDIFGVEILNDGTVGTPFQLTNTPEDESDLYVSDYSFSSYFHRDILWVGDNKIFVSDATINSDTIVATIMDTIICENCSNPVIDWQYKIYWKKTINDSSQVYYSHPVYDSAYSQPQPLFTSGNSTNLAVEIFNLKGQLSPGYFCWENNGRILWINWESIDSVALSGFEQMHHPNAYMFVTGKWPGDTFFLTFSAGTGDEEEIYYGLKDNIQYENISNNNRRDYNPDFFIGRKYSKTSADFIIIWQSEVNGKSVLYMSYNNDIFTGNTAQGLTDEPQISIKAIPNPFSNRLEILYKLQNKEAGALDIYDLSGKNIFHKNIAGNGGEEQSFIWDTKAVPEGSYLIRLSQGKYSKTIKVLHTK